MIEILFAAYFALSCHNLGEHYNKYTEYLFGQGCYTRSGKLLPRTDKYSNYKCSVCSVASSLEAHRIMSEEES